MRRIANVCAVLTVTQIIKPKEPVTISRANHANKTMSQKRKVRLKKRNHIRQPSKRNIKNKSHHSLPKRRTWTRCMVRAPSLYRMSARWSAKKTNLKDPRCPFYNPNHPKKKQTFSSCKTRWSAQIQTRKYHQDHYNSRYKSKVRMIKI